MLPVRFWYDEAQEKSFHQILVLLGFDTKHRAILAEHCKISLQHSWIFAYQMTLAQNVLL